MASDVQNVGRSRGDGEASPRGAALADLYRHAERLASAGDLAAARELHAVIGRLLGGAAPADGAAVVDLGAERVKRGRSE